MQHANPDQKWTEWVAANSDKDEATKLAALREYITEGARTWVRNGEINTNWANKKLAKLGITEFIEREHRYTVTATVTGKVELVAYGTNRTEALTKVKAQLDGRSGEFVSGLTAVDEPVVIHGPEDVSTTVADDAPQTVEDTLTVLREVIMLGHISGPRFCERGANEVLADYGLAPIPARKTFTVSRPVTAQMTTQVEAYDEASALRVAGWRWDDDRNSYETASVDPADELKISVAS